MRRVASIQQLSPERLASEAEVLESQSIIVDFFEQVGLVDQFISPMKTTWFMAGLQ